MVSIVPFERTQANEYIDSKVSQEQRTKPFYECRDLIFANLAFSVANSGHSSAANEFLHYPPVLDVITTLLKDEPNLQQLKNILGNFEPVNPENSIELLQRIIDRILDREQGKVLPAIRSVLSEQAATLNWSDWGELYSKDEQCKRLLGRVFSHHIAATPTALPLPMQQNYEDCEAIAAALPEHPFLQGVDQFANRVFESYLHARALLDELGSGAKEAVTRSLLDQGDLPSRLLAAFYLSGGRDGGERVIAPEHLGLIYDSLASDDSNQSLVRLSVDGSDPTSVAGAESQDAEAEFEFIAFDDEGTVVTPLLDPVSFVLPLSNDTTLCFPNQLRDAVITAPCRVELGTSGKDFPIGPDVHIHAQVLAIAADSIVVKSRTKRLVGEATNEVVMEAEQYESEGSFTKTPMTYEGSSLTVTWPGAEQYPWTKFAEPPAVAEVEDEDDLADVYRRFKRIVTTFKSNGRGSLARTRLKIEHHRVLQGSMGQELLEQLLEDEILTLRQNRYFWNAGQADELLGVSWQDLRKGKVPALLAEYLRGFVRERPELFKA